MWVRTECLRTFCWLLYVSVGNVEMESPVIDGRTGKSFVMESLLDKEVSCVLMRSVLPKHEGNVLTTGEVLCSAFLQVYESSLPVKEMETRLFPDLVLSGLCLLLAASQSAKLLALKSMSSSLFVAEVINYCPLFLQVVY